MIFTSAIPETDKDRLSEAVLRMIRRQLASSEGEAQLSKEVALLKAQKGENELRVKKEMHSPKQVHLAGEKSITSQDHCITHSQQRKTHEQRITEGV